MSPDRLLESRLRGLRPLGDLVFRLALAPIFIVGGLGHFVRHDEMMARVAESPWADMVGAIADPGFLLRFSGVNFVIFGAMLALGWQARLSALVLFLTLVPITIAIHVAPGHTGPLLKNVAILGALFRVFVLGAGAWSIDVGRRATSRAAASAA